MKAAKHEESKYELLPIGAYIDGDWTHYAIMPIGGKIAVGGVLRRSGGGWIATLPIFAMEDNGIQDVRKKVGYAHGRGETPAEALQEADRRALQGITGAEEYEQGGLL
jgi:hypothetical protein